MMYNPFEQFQIFLHTIFKKKYLGLSFLSHSIYITESFMVITPLKGVGGATAGTQAMPVYICHVPIAAQSPLAAER